MGGLASGNGTGAEGGERRQWAASPVPRGGRALPSRPASVALPAPQRGEAQPEGARGAGSGPHRPRPGPAPGSRQPQAGRPAGAGLRQGAAGPRGWAAEGARRRPRRAPPRPPQRLPFARPGPTPPALGQNRARQDWPPTPQLRALAPIVIPPGWERGGGGGAASQPRRRQRWPGGRGEQPAPRHGVPWGWTVPIPPATGCQRCCLLCWRSERPGGAAAQGQSPAPWGHKAKAVGQPSPPTWPHAPELPPVLAPSPPRHKCRRERAGALPRAPCSLHPRDQRSGSPHPTLSCPLPACVSLHHPRDTAQPPRSVPARLRGAARAGSAPC